MTAEKEKQRAFIWRWEMAAITVMSCGDNFLIKSLNALLQASPPVAEVK
jgi:hypothetical protein